MKCVDLLFNAVCLKVLFHFVISYCDNFLIVRFCPCKVFLILVFKIFVLQGNIKHLLK